MRTVFILRDALASSLLTTLYYAMESRMQEAEAVDKVREPAPPPPPKKGP